MKSILVIGLGRFGRHLALKLMELGNDVMVVDRDEEIVEHLASCVTSSFVGDCRETNVIKALGVNNFDVCFVCISNDFQGSLEVTYELKENGAPFVVARADRDSQSKFLQKIGADEVIHPEKEMAQRTAVKYSATNSFEYIELTSDYIISEIKVPNGWIKRTVSEVNVRTTYNVNIIGVKSNGKITPFVNATHVFEKDEHIVIAGTKKDVMALTEKKHH